MRIRIFVLTLLLFCAGSVRLYGQEAPTGRQQAASDLVDLLHLREATQQAVDAMIDGMVSQNPALADVGDVMRDFMKEYMDWNKLRPEYIRMYAQAFTEPELRQLIAFYKTPTGQKTVRVMPQLMRQGSELGQRMIQPHLPELQRRIEARMRQRMAPADSDTVPPRHDLQPMRP